MRTAVCGVMAVVLLATAGSAFADAPTYTLQIQARANFAQNPGGSFNIPGSWFFSNEDIQLNDSREVSLKLGVTSGLFQSIWVGQNGAGSVVFNSVDDAFLSTTSINNHGRVVWPQTFAGTPGIYFYNRPTNTSGFQTSQPLGTSTWGSVQINDAGQIGYRAGFSSGQAFVSYDPSTNSHSVHAVEAVLDPNSPYTFLYTPSFNNSRQIAGKVSLSGNRDQIRIFNANGTSSMIAEDRDSNPSSPYTGFDNSVGFNDNGQVAFIANLFPSGRAVIVSDGTPAGTHTIATQNVAPLGSLEFFKPSLNNSGLVAFRAFDNAGLRVIWVGDGSFLTRIVTQYDIVPTDLGNARVTQETPSSPVFGGSPKINNNGDVVFYCGVAPPDNDQVEWGSAVFVAIASVPPPACPADANNDQQVNAADLSVLLANFGTASSGPAEGDFNNDGQCNSADLSILLSNFGQSC